MSFVVGQVRYLNSVPQFPNPSGVILNMDTLTIPDAARGGSSRVFLLQITMDLLLQTSCSECSSWWLLLLMDTAPAGVDVTLTDIFDTASMPGLAVQVAPLRSRFVKLAVQYCDEVKSLTHLMHVDYAVPVELQQIDYLGVAGNYIQARTHSFIAVYQVFQPVLPASYRMDVNLTFDFQVPQPPTSYS